MEKGGGREGCEVKGGALEKSIECIPGRPAIVRYERVNAHRERASGLITPHLR